jgi:hypothetical protein
VAAFTGLEISFFVIEKSNFVQLYELFKAANFNKSLAMQE